MRTLFDTSVLVPALVDQLGNHRAAFDALHRYTDDDDRGYCSTHALAECYATLTALPLPKRVLPEEARSLVEESICGRLSAIEMVLDDYLEVLCHVARLGLTSGAVHDALHVRCAQKAAVDRILTYNVAHFERFDLAGIDVMAP